MIIKTGKKPKGGFNSPVIFVKALGTKNSGEREEKMAATEEKRINLIPPASSSLSKSGLIFIALATRGIN